MAAAEERQSELKRIYDRDGWVQASVVVKESVPKKAPLHDEFEWDDQKAGHAFRLGQARRLIRVTPLVEPTGAKSRFIHVPVERIEGPTAVLEEREGVYKPVREVVREPKELERALRELMVQRDAMDRTIRDLKRAAKQSGKTLDLLPQLEDGLRIVKQTLRLMLKAA